MKGSEYRADFLDVLKGLAIITVVQCHCRWILPITGFNIGDFVTAFNIPAFIFVSGFLFRGVTSKNELYEHVGRRIIKMMYLYIAYTAAYAVLNPLFAALHIIPDENRIWIYNALLYSVLMQNTEPLLSTMWFVPMFILSTCFFACGFSFSSRQRRPLLWHSLFALLCAVLGLYALHIKMHVTYYVRQALICVPILYGGFLSAKYREKLSPYVTWWGAILAGAAILVIYSLQPGRLELGEAQIVSPLLFYPVCALGIYMGLGATKVLARIPVLANVLANLGRNSFHIMALHLIGIKIIDVIYGRIMGYDPSVYSVLPRAFDLWPLNLLGSILFSVAVAELGKWLIPKCKSLLKIQ